MNANFFSSFLHLDLNDDGMEDDIQWRPNNPLLPENIRA